MPYERLINSKRIKQHRANQNEIKQLLQLATRDLSTAVRNLEEAPDWAYSIAYNSILQASRALMFFDGYRPRGGDQHATVVEFVEERLGAGYAPQVRLFDQMRRKRHRVTLLHPNHLQTEGAGHMAGGQDGWKFYTDRDAPA